MLLEFVLALAAKQTLAGLKEENPDQHDIQWRCVRVDDTDDK